MAVYNLNLEAAQNEELNHDDSGSATPQLLRLMLQNVYLNPEKTRPPLEQLGEFWYWKLSYYALELMRALLRSSSSAFSYTDAFMELETETIPDLMLLRQIDIEIRNQLEQESYSSDWKAIFDSSPYLREKAVSVNPALFQSEINKLLTRIRQAVFEPSGNRRIYASVSDLLGSNA